MLKKWWFNHLIKVVASGLLLFIAAGTLQWTMAWIYLLLWISFIIIKRHVIHPDLLNERSIYREGKKWDKLTAPFIMIVGPLCVFLIAGLEHRFAGTVIASNIQIFALLLMVFSACLSIWTIQSNQFYSVNVRILYERNHVVVMGGPYRFIRHPGYLGWILAAFATPLMLGSWFAMVPSLFIMLGFFARTLLEDITLQRHFKGYYDYTKKVPYRLFPGIW